jgi:hypothetical protein
VLQQWTLRNIVGILDALYIDRPRMTRNDECKLISGGRELMKSHVCLKVGLLSEHYLRKENHEKHQSVFYSPAKIVLGTTRMLTP